MRLSQIEKNAILESTRSFDSNCQVFLYGSRANPDLKGGDIDLLVLSDKIDFSEKVFILVKIKKIIGEQKIDLTVKKLAELHTDPLIQAVRSQWVELV